MKPQDFIRELETHEIDKETWQGIVQNVITNAEQVIKLYRNKFSIKFVDPSNIEEDSINARAGKFTENSYEIAIYPRLIDMLRRYSWFVMSFEDIFKSLGTTAEDRLKAADFLMYMWTDFIFWHEFFHVRLGHIDYLWPNMQLFELASKSKKLDDHELWIYRTLEAEADSCAAKATFARFSKYKHALLSAINNKSGESDTYYDFFLAINVLFGLLGFLEGDVEASTHPLPSIRNYLVQSFIPDLDSSRLKDVSLKRETLVQLASEALINYELLMDAKVDEIKASAIEAVKYSAILDEYLKEINRTRKLLF